MRREDREVTDRNEIIEIMRRCDVCRLAIHDEEYPYIVPLNFGLLVDEDSMTLVFHSALEGTKLDLLKIDNRVSFEMDCQHQLQYFEEKGICTMAYESVIGRGRITFLEGEEKFGCLQAIMEQYHHRKDVYFNPATVERTAVYVLQVESVTGKRKLPK